MNNSCFNDISNKKNENNSIRNGDTDSNNKWNLTRTSQFTDKSVEVITRPHQLQTLEDFIAKKLQTLQNEQYRAVTSSNSNVASASSSSNSDAKKNKDSQVSEGLKINFLFFRYISSFMCNFQFAKHMLLIAHYLLLTYQEFISKAKRDRLQS